MHIETGGSDDLFWYKVFVDLDEAVCYSSGGVIVADDDVIWWRLWCTDPCHLSILTASLSLMLSLRGVIMGWRCYGRLYRIAQHSSHLGVQHSAGGVMAASEALV